MEEKKKEETEAEAAVQNAFNNQRQPNIIGNAEDMQGVQAVEEETPHLGGVDVQMEQPFGGEGGQFADITGQLTRSKRKRGKSPI